MKITILKELLYENLALAIGSGFISVLAFSRPTWKHSFDWSSHPFLAMWLSAYVLISVAYYIFYKKPTPVKVKDKETKKRGKSGVTR